MATAAFGSRLYILEKFAAPRSQAVAPGETPIFTFIDMFKEEPMKSKRPMEIAVTALAAAQRGFEASAADIKTALEASTAFAQFVEEYKLSNSITQSLMGLTACGFYMGIARHILGTAEEAFSDAYGIYKRDLYTKIYRKLLSTEIASPEATVGPVGYYLKKRRVIDIRVGLIQRAFALADEMAMAWLSRVGYSGNDPLQSSTMNIGFDQQFKEWQTKLFKMCADMLSDPDAYIRSLLSETSDFYDEVKVIRRACEVAPRLTLTRSSSGTSAKYSATFRDRSKPLPVRTRIAAGYPYMAFSITGDKVVPVVDMEEISELLLDLTVTAEAESTDTTIDLFGASAVVGKNLGTRYDTSHVERYLTETGFAATGELAGYLLEYPKGSASEIFSSEQTQLPQSAGTISDIIAGIDHPQLMTRQTFKFFGEEIEVTGMGCNSYSLWFFQQVLASFIPHTSETGKISLQITDTFSAPTTIAEIPSMVGETTTHHLDKSLIFRLATTSFNISPAVLNDNSLQMMGTDLLKYYWSVLKLLGFDEIVAQVKTKANYTPKNVSELLTEASSPLSMILSWTNGVGWDNRFKALGVAGNKALMFRVNMMRVYLSSITNERVLKAFLQAMSLYLVYDCSSQTSSTVESLWKGTLTDSLLG